MKRLFKESVFYRIEYVALSKDVTDADLKQRRELQNSTSFYVDQAAVRAAINGRILVLDGIEKAERNVLPILNNLLENREMSLEDGRFLTTKDITSTADTKFEKVSPRFLVFALGKIYMMTMNYMTLYSFFELLRTICTTLCRLPIGSSVEIPISKQRYQSA